MFSQELWQDEDIGGGGRSISLIFATVRKLSGILKVCVIIFVSFTIWYLKLVLQYLYLKLILQYLYLKLILRYLKLVLKYLKVTRTKIKLHVKKVIEITEDPDGIQTGTNVQNIDWQERLAVPYFSSIFLKEPNQIITGIERDTPQVKLENVTTDDNAQILDKPEKIARRQLREKRREKGAAELVHQDTEAIIKLENSAIEHSKAVDSSVLGKYCLLRRENENENLDSTIRLMRDQMIMARVYATIARMKNKLDLYLELSERLKESQCALGDANTDADLGRSAPEKIKAMGQVLSKAREQLYDCKLVTQKLRVMLQSADEQVRLCLKKQSTFLSQLVTKTVPNGIHCLSMRFTISYYLLPPEKRKFPRSENPNLYHYALFSDNVLAASVVVNSTIMNAKEPEKHVFHLVTDKLNFGAMNMWFLLSLSAIYY